MSNPTTHLLVPLILADIYRDYFAKKKFSLFYMLVAGIAGLFPDIDVAIWWVLRLFTETPMSAVHRQFTHTIFIPLAFLLVAFLWRQNRKAMLLFGMAAFGIFTHLALDVLFSGSIMPFYPLSRLSVGLNIIPMLGIDTFVFAAVFDGMILVAWLVHEYAKRKIRDFI